MLHLMESIWSDLRYALRQARTIPTFTMIVVMLIGLGLAANATIFTLFDALLLRKLPVKNPEELVRIVEHHPPLPDSSAWDYGYWELLRASAMSFSEVIGNAEVEVPMLAGGITEAVKTGVVTENYFAALGVVPALGSGWR